MWTMGWTIESEGGSAHEHAATQLLWDIGDACEALGIRRSKLYELVATGQLGSVKVGSRRLIPDTAMVAFVASLTEA